MSQTGSWNKFSNDQRAREAAREAAMAEGITLGEYLNRLLTTVDEPQPGETPYSYSRRTGAPPVQPQQDSATTLDRLARRIEATEARSTLAINGIDHAVHGLVARLQNAEQTTVAVAGHVEGLIDEMRATHEALQSKVRRLESDDNSSGNIEALKALEGALGKLATHVYEEGELTQNETVAIKGRIESGFADLTDRVEGIETRVDRTLSDAAARVERAVEQAELRAEGTARGLAERMSTLEDKLAQAAPSDERLSAVEADVSGALDSMESTLLRIQERLNRAETSTDSALKSLETTFAHLDERIEAVASQVDPELAGRLKQEFEQRFEDLTRSVRSAVDNARLELASEITLAAAGQDEKLEERLKAEVSELKARLAEVEAREPADLTATVQEEIGRLGNSVAERIDALAAHVEDRIEESEMRSAEAIEQVGEQVTVAAVRLQKRQDEAITALAQDIDGMRQASDARLSDALAGVSERLEQIQSQSSESLSPVQRAIVALATRLESLEAFTTPPHVPVPPPVLQPDFVANTPPIAVEQNSGSMFETADTHGAGLPAFSSASDDTDFEAGFAGWDVHEEKAPAQPYDSDFEELTRAVQNMVAETSAAAHEAVVEAAPEQTHNYISDMSADAAGDEEDDARGFDPISELDVFADDVGDHLEDSHSETRESDIFDDEPDFARALAEAAPGEPVSAADDEQTADYLARARRAALAASDPHGGRGRNRVSPPARAERERAAQKASAKLPLLLAASAVAITGAGVGGYLYLRGKQPVTPTLSGPVDTYVDPETGTPAATTTTAAAERPAPVDAEQMLFEDETALVAADLFEDAALAETETETEAPVSEILALAQTAAATSEPVEAPAAQPVAIIASVQPAPPQVKPAIKVAPKPEPKPAVKLTPEQAAIKSIVTAAEAIEAAEPPSLKPDAADLAGAPTTEPARLTTRGNTGFPSIPVVVTVEAEASAGNAVAQYQYAQVLLADGDLEGASSYLRRAAQKGIAPAQYELGKLYERGHGVDKDITEARNLIQKAAEAGHTGAMYDYALFLAEGEGGAKSETEAVDWFTQAAERGVVDAQYNLGVVNAEGIGVPKDLAKALFWFEVAAKAGDTGAEQEVANLRTRVSMTESLDARDQANAWKAEAPNALANGKFGAQRWNTGNPLQVQAVQTALGRLGFGAGTPDGVVGPRTADAIRDYQAMEGLEQTGTITPELVDHLNARASGARRS
ncbi:peptidoglycan-binding protein [Hyphomonas sp.]|uniref:peptidoglycan-binding protein n=1 Tax=Hyphomonas sp. TaxID=87 RepID=UPI00391DEBC3